MKTFAVACVNFFDNNLQIEFIHAEAAREALYQHSQLQDQEMKDWLKNMPDDLDEIKEFFFNCDALIDVVEVPDR